MSWNNNNNSLGDIREDDSEDGEIDEEEGEIVLPSDNPPPPPASASAPINQPPALASSISSLQNISASQQQRPHPPNFPPPSLARRNSWQGRGGPPDGLVAHRGRGFPRGGGRLGNRRHSFNTIDVNNNNQRLPLPLPGASRSQSFSAVPMHVVSQSQQQLHQQQHGPSNLAPAGLSPRPTDPRFRGGFVGNSSHPSAMKARMAALEHSEAGSIASSTLLVQQSDQPAPDQREHSLGSSSNDGRELQGRDEGLQQTDGETRSNETSHGLPRPPFLNMALSEPIPRIPHLQSRRPSSNISGHHALEGSMGESSYYGPAASGSTTNSASLGPLARLRTGEHGMATETGHYGPAGAMDESAHPGVHRTEFPTMTRNNVPPSTQTMGHYGPSSDNQDFMATEEDHMPFAGASQRPPVDARGQPAFARDHEGRPFADQPRSRFDGRIPTHQRYAHAGRGDNWSFGPRQQMEHQGRGFGPHPQQHDQRNINHQPDNRGLNQQGRVFGPQQRQPPLQDRGFGFRKPPFSSESLSPRGSVQGAGGFSRDRRDWTQRASPQSSPFGRKNIVPMPLQGPAIPLPAMDGNEVEVEKERLQGDAGQLKDDKSAAQTHTAGVSAITVLSDVSMPPPAAPPAAPSSAPIVAPLTSLTTKFLGDEATIERAEAAIKKLSELVGNPSLKATPGPESHSDLPSKQLLFHALATMDTTVKALQQQVTDTESELEHTERFAEAEVASAQHRAKQSFLDVDKDRSQQEEAARRVVNDESERELELQLQLAQNSFDVDLSSELAKLDEQVAASKQQEQTRLAEATIAQVIVAAENFDKDITKARRELERAAHSTKKTETKVAIAETSYQAKIESDYEQKESNNAECHKIPSLVSNILAENKRRAAESHMSILFNGLGDEAASTARDPKFGLTNTEWGIKARQVTGLADALYSEPCETPYYDTIEQNHAAIAALVKEFIRDKQIRLQVHWNTLAIEYGIRQKAHDKHLQKLNAGKTKRQRSSSIVRHSIFSKPGLPILESQGGRTSSNPYRRARRGNEVRSEYEQEQIIAELAAKEAYERKISHGGSDLPRQIGQLERSLTATFYNTFEGQRVNMMEQEANLALENVWTDMEKCIFLDRFMQHPKDFRKIAMFLRNKGTNDCVKFYYDSKPYVPYKAALKEFLMRRKKKESATWDATIDAAISCGAVVVAGDSEEKPLVFMLPETSCHHTCHFHPMKREILDSLNENDVITLDVAGDDSDDETPRDPGKPKRRSHIPLFHLDPEQRKFIKGTSSHEHLKLSLSRASLAETEMTGDSNSLGDIYDERTEKTLTPMRRPPQKWNEDEKNIFVETLAKHGRDWNLLANAVGTKSTSQIKNYYYDYMKQSGKLRPDKAKKLRVDGRKRKREQETDTNPTQFQGSDNSEPSLPLDEVPQLAPVLPLGQQPPDLHSGPALEALFRQQQEQTQNFQVMSNQVNDYSATDIWLHQQLQQQQAHHNQAPMLSSNTDEMTHQLLQRHTSQSQQRQQLLQNMLPWNAHNQPQMRQSSASHDYLSDASSFATSSQLQALLQLQQQQQQHRHQQPHHQHNPLGAYSAGGNISSLSGISGLNSSVLELALAQQQRNQQQQHHHHLAQQHQSSQQLSAEQIALQQLLGLGDSSDALALLRHAMNSNRQN